MSVYETPKPISVVVELGVGDVRITASDREDTAVEVRASDSRKKADVVAAEQTHVEFAGGRLLVKGPKGWRQWTPWGGRESVDVEIDLPTGSEIRCEAGLGTLRFAGRMRECICKSGMGDVQIEEVDNLQLKTGAGAITLGRVLERADVVTGTGLVEIGSLEGISVVKNSNGDTRIRNVSGDLKVNAANGNIAVDETRGSVRAKSANGNIRVGDISGGSIVADTARGSVELGVRDGVAAWLDLDTQIGRVRSDLDSSGPPTADETSVEVRACTSFGDITIHRSLASAMEKERA